MRHLKDVLPVLLLAFLTACSSGEKPAAEAEVGVVATKEFVRHFGPVPSVETGKAYAFVIYFPSEREPGKVIPFPFFSFDEPSLKKVALGKLASGIGELKGYQGEIAQPFPPGTRLVDVVQTGGQVTATFSKQWGVAKQDQARARAMVDAVALTLSQFDGVTGVGIRFEGAKGAPINVAKKAVESDRVRLGPPRLLGVTAMKEKGESDVAEIDAVFDRPLQIRELVISGADGKPFAGETYLSVFDMAGVLKPKDPSGFKQGMPVKVRWSVVDKLGRSASGEGEMLLEVKEH